EPISSSSAIFSNIKLDTKHVRCFRVAGFGAFFQIGFPFLIGLIAPFAEPVVCPWVAGQESLIKPFEHFTSSAKGFYVETHFNHPVSRTKSDSSLIPKLRLRNIFVLRVIAHEDVA